jgi:hypothetical protein
MADSGACTICCLLDVCSKVIFWLGGLLGMCGTRHFGFKKFSKILDIFWCQGKATSSVGLLG